MKQNVPGLREGQRGRRGRRGCRGGGAEPGLRRGPAEPLPERRTTEGGKIHRFMGKIIYIYIDSWGRSYIYTYICTDNIFIVYNISYTINSIYDTICISYSVEQ